MDNSRETRRGSALRGWLWGVYLLLFPSFITAAVSFADDTPQAEALLKGVEKRLSEYSSFTVTFEVEDRMLPRAQGKYTVTADYDNGKILFLVEYPEGTYPKKTAFLFRNEWVSIYDDRLPNVQVRPWQYAVGIGAPILFDPRTIGFSDLQSLGASITACLSLDGRAEEYRVETIAGDDFQESQESQEPRESQQAKEQRYAVTVKSDSPIGKVEKTYQIQEPSFRVEKVRFRNEQGDLTIEVDNQYDDEISPILPSVSKMLRIDNGTVDVDKTITVKSFSQKQFDDDHFTSESIPFKPNTPFLDDRWDSINKKIADSLALLAQRQKLKMDRYFWIKTVFGTASFAILVILLFRVKRWWKENGDTKNVD